MTRSGAAVDSCDHKFLEKTAKFEPHFYNFKECDVLKESHTFLKFSVIGFSDIPSIRLCSKDLAE